MNAQEVNFDGLVGPTHNYSGLSYGNVASIANERALANPREAALQGLEKMNLLSSLGITQVVLPPHQRPFTPLLRRLGFEGSDQDIWKNAIACSPEFVRPCCSAAAMWAANAGTASPSTDAADRRMHFSPANLAAKLHRSIEPQTTERIFDAIFLQRRLFAIHSPLPSSPCLSDEGAANHTRLCRQYGERGIHIFTWGRSGLDAQYAEPVKFPARQTLEASQAIARQHKLDPDCVVFAQQSPTAIDAGVFHNDVIAVGNQNVFFFHQEAFVSQAGLLEEISHKFAKTCQAELIPICVASHRVSLEEAVKTYLFNSQLITLKDSSMALVLPAECEQNERVRIFLEEICADSSNPIQKLFYLQLHQSMKNGGGPACLRLRIVLSEKELSCINQGVLLTNELSSQLKAWILKHYRDRLSPQDLYDPQLLVEAYTALDELTKILKIGPIYDFQRENSFP